MEIRIYDANMDFHGLIENQTSVLWNRKYFESGSFELYCPITPNNMSLIQRGHLVWIRGAKEAGVIESIRLEQTNIKNEITAKGRFLESYLSRRLIYPTYTASNKLVEVAMHEIVSRAVALPLVRMGELQGFTDRVTFQATYKNVLDYETKLAKFANIGFRMVPDFSNKTITFECYRGLDHSWNQSDRTRVIFSQAYNNIASAVYNENDQLLKTVCFVGGEGEGSARTIAIAGDNSLTGLERREVFINASDLRSEGLTASEYEKNLIQRGNNELQHDALAQTFECDTDANRNFMYKRDYDLGDIVTIKKENWGVSADMRMAGLTEVYEYGAVRVSPVFGNPLPETIDWSEANG